MRLMRAIILAISGLAGVTVCLAQAPQTPSRWAQPAADLAGQISDILGPGQAQLTVRNISTIELSELPAISRLLGQDLKAHGVLTSGTESANEIRVTLSESAHERLWVAEVIEGTVMHVAMAHVGSVEVKATSDANERLVLRKERAYDTDVFPCFPDDKPPLLAVLETRRDLAILKQGCLLALDHSTTGFADGKGFYHLDSSQSMTRDPRGILVANSSGNGFLAYYPGTACEGRLMPTEGQNRLPREELSLHCHPSDDPWPIVSDPVGTASLKAFYNPARNYFTGVVVPSIGVDLPAFYTARMIPRAAGGAALLITGIDGKVSLAENGTSRTIAGTRDWGSDFAVVRSGCGSGTQVIASSSGEAVSDSLRAYEIPSLEAIPASAPVAMDGTVTALWAAEDGNSAFAVVRNAKDRYEVDRVTALCN